MAAMPDWDGIEGQLHEPLEPAGARRRWRAEAGGRPAIAIEAQMGSARDAAAVGARLRRLFGRQDPRLPELLGWAVEGTTVWVLTSDNVGNRSLAELLRAGPLSPAEAAAVTWAVLSGLEAMHEAGVAHGRISPETVVVDASGAVRLEGGWFTPEARGGAGEMVADVEAAGSVGLAALGVANTAGGPAGGAELEAPALTRMMRAIASGASGSNVAGARMALAATAGPLVEPEGLARARERLLRRAGAGLVPSAAPVADPIPTVLDPQVEEAAPVRRPRSERPASTLRPPLEQAAAAPAPAVPARHYVATAADFETLDEGFDWARLRVPAIALGIALVLLSLAWVGARALGHHSSPSSSAGVPAAAPSTFAPASATPRGTPTSTSTSAPKPAAGPSFGPAASGDVKSVAMQVSGCAPGGSCSADIVVTTTQAAAANDISWTVRAYNPCTGSTSDVGSGHFTEQAGWTTIDVNQALSLPSAKGQLLLSAVTSAPASAASPAVTVGQGGC